MTLSARLRNFALLVPVLATAALITPAFAGSRATAPAAAAPVLVMRYTFDGGAPAGRVADNSGRGQPLTLRSADRGSVRFNTGLNGKYVSFPAPCARNATPCARALLEAPNVPALNPGTRSFTWGATVRVSKTQVSGSSNVMQKGVVSTESQWKMQLGARQGRAQCVVVGRGDATPYLVRSSVAVADGGWHRIMCRRAGATLTVFVDGRDRGHRSIPGTLSIGNTLPMRIGGPNFASTSDMFHGQLDDAYAILG